MLRTALLVTLVGWTTTHLTTAGSTATTQPQFKTSLVTQAGSYVPLPDAAHQPRPDSRIVFDVAGADGSDKIVKGLDRVAMYLNLAHEQGISPKQLKLTVVLHGSATAAALDDAHYAAAAGDANVSQNPNLPLIHTLKSHGVEVYVCGQALARKGYVIDGVADDVTVAVSALTVIANEQLAGAAYVPFH